MASGGASPPSFPSTELSTPLTSVENLSLNRSTSSSTAKHVSSSPSNPVTKICVFCGASPGKSPAHMEAARNLARVMHENNIHLVYGGGTVGLMGEIARTLVSLSGPQSVHGIIPAPLVRYERGPDSAAASDFSLKSAVPEEAVYGKTTVVKDMHSRKKLMAEEILASGPGSGFIALPGGYGTLEELMETVTWNQLGIHNRGAVILNIEGYYDGILEWVNGAVEAGFIGEGNRAIICEAKTPEKAVQSLANYRVAAGRFKLEWGNE